MMYSKTKAEPKKKTMTTELFEEIRYPSVRRLTQDIGKIGRKKHHVQALLEVDITEARSRIKLIGKPAERFPLWPG